jgi:hypothetical protein
MRSVSTFGLQAAQIPAAIITNAAKTIKRIYPIYHIPAHQYLNTSLVATLKIFASTCMPPKIKIKII